MKKLIAACVISLFTIAAYSQNSNAILFTENGERFKVVLNGVLQNDKGETNVKLTQLNAPNYKCRILFEDAALGYVDFNMFFNNPGSEVTWNIKKNNKGAYVVRFVSEVAIADAPPSPPSQPQVAYTTTPATTTTTNTQQQQTTTGTGNSDNFSLNMGVNSNGEGGNISINATGMDGGTQQSGYATTTTTTTHTVTTTTTGNMPPPPPPPPSSKPVNVIYVPGYSGPVGCPMPVSESEFNQMKESIRAKSFEETKLTISKQILKDNCVTSAQVRDLLGLFDFENTKLEFAKYAYSKTYDTGNYYKVNDAFEFESSVDELNKYIGNK
jgi:hypothetical protein